MDIVIGWALLIGVPYLGYTAAYRVGTGQWNWWSDL